MADPAQVQILIDVKSRLDELAKTQAAFRAARQEAESFGSVIKQGFGLGTGMELARRGVELLKASIEESIDSAFRLAKEIKQNASDIGFSGEAYQVFKNELHESGVEMGRLTMAVSAQTQSLAAARDGAGAAFQAYKDLHLVASEIEAMPADQRLLAVAKATLDASDQTKAFTAAGNILGSRGLPSLLGALKNLATEGYGALSQEMIKAGKIMDDQSAALLRSNEKQLEALKQKRTVATGEILGFFTLLAMAAKDDPIGLLKSPFSFNYGTTAFLAKYMPKTEATPGNATPGPADRDDINLARIQSLQQSIADVQGDQLMTETERRRQLVVLLGQQAGLYLEIQKSKFADSTDLVVKAASGTLTEEELNRYKQYVALLAKEAEIRNARVGLVSPKSDAKKIDEEYDVFKSGKNAQGGAVLSPGEGIMAGFKQFAMQVGPLGSQIASTIQGTIGGAVSSLTNGIVGLITHTRSLGSAAQDMGMMFLQAVTQMIIQAIALAVVMGIVNVLTGGAVMAGGGFSGGFMKGLTGKARGGDVAAGTPYIVGEERPEVFVPDVPGRIIPSVDQFRVASGALTSGRSSSHGAGTASSPMVNTMDRLHVLYTDDAALVARLSRRTDVEVMVTNIGKRRRGEIFAV